MGLAIAIKCPEGVVLASDSTLTVSKTIAQTLSGNISIPVPFDNIRLIWGSPRYTNIGVASFGEMWIGKGKKYFLPNLIADFDVGKTDQINLMDFANKLRDFLKDKCKESDHPSDSAVLLLVAGRDFNVENYRVILINVLSKETPNPKEWWDKDYGMAWGGQTDSVSRLINGCAAGLAEQISKINGLTPEASDSIAKLFREQEIVFPWHYMSLKSCVELSRYIIESSSGLQRWMFGVRGVGGRIQIATIAHSENFKLIQD